MKMKFLYFFQSYQHNPWLVHLAVKFLQNDDLTTSLIAHNPFAGKDPPKSVAYFYIICKRYLLFELDCLIWISLTSCQNIESSILIIKGVNRCKTIITGDLNCLTSQS